MAGDAIHARGTVGNLAGRPRCKRAVHVFVDVGFARLLSDAIVAQRAVEREVKSVDPFAFEADGLNVLAIGERDDDWQQFLGVFFGPVFIG